jgi:hypothetical protein
VSEGSSNTKAFKKKLYANGPGTPPALVEVHRSKRRTRLQAFDDRRLERDVRQMLADKVIGNLVGIWLLVPEHLRLGTWDLLGGWTGAGADALPRRLAMQLIHESALCLTGLREQRADPGFQIGEEAG